jgi:hypothetical protein
LLEVVNPQPPFGIRLGQGAREERFELVGLAGPLFGEEHWEFEIFHRTEAAEFRG